MIKVAISDAHPVTRNGVRSALEGASEFEVVGEAVDGATTLALVRATDACVLTLGLVMPGIHGVELIKSIKNENSALRILVLTMHLEETHAVRVFKAGASGFVSKNSPRADFVAAAKKVASGGVYVSLTMADQLPQSFNEAAASALPHQRLSGREFDIFVRIASGESVTAIARTLCLSTQTVSRHRAHILEKTKMSTDAALVRYAVRHALLEDDDKNGTPTFA